MMTKFLITIFNHTDIQLKTIWLHNQCNNIHIQFLPPPRRISNRRCLFVCQQLCTKTSEGICMKFSRKVSNGPMTQTIKFWWQFSSPSALFSGFVTIGRYGKCLMDINLLLALICQMAALVKRALAEVSTVPVLLVTAYFCIIYLTGGNSWPITDNWVTIKAELRSLSSPWPQ